MKTVHFTKLEIKQKNYIEEQKKYIDNLEILIELWFKYLNDMVSNMKTAFKSYGKRNDTFSK